MNHAQEIIEIPCEQIRIGERHRKDMGDLEVLATSIATVGLLHPPVVTEDGLLVCGERRFLAMRDILRWKTIPVIVLQVSSIVAGEYAENEIRKGDRGEHWQQAGAAYRQGTSDQLPGS